MRLQSIPEDALGPVAARASAARAMRAWSGSVLGWLLIGLLLGSLPWAWFSLVVTVALVGLVLARSVAKGGSAGWARVYLLVGQAALVASVVAQLIDQQGQTITFAVQMVCCVYAVRSLGIVIRDEPPKVADVFD